MPLVPLSVPYFFFISSANVFSLNLSSIISVVSIPPVVKPVIYMISLTVMGMGVSCHTSPPCVKANNCLTHANVYWPLPKCGIFNNPRILVPSGWVAHWCGWVMVSLSWFMTIFCIKTCGARYGYLVSSAMSWYEYLSFPTWPNSYGSTRTPSGMRGSTISAASLFRGELGIWTHSSCRC